MSAPVERPSVRELMLHALIRHGGTRAMFTALESGAINELEDAFLLAAQGKLSKEHPEWKLQRISLYRTDER